MPAPSPRLRGHLPAIVLVLAAAVLLAGCSSLGTLRTFLQDAYDAGARILVGTEAQRILVEGGRAAGVSAVCTVDGESRPITVRAPQVVVACGAEWRCRPMP